MLKLVAMFTAALASAPVAVCAGDLTGQEIRIGVAGPLTTPSATFGVEMRQAVDLAIDERNGAGGLLGGKVAAEVIDDQADAEKGKAAAKALCDDPRVLAVVGHVNSGVMLASEKVYADCGLPIVTPMASNPAITEQGLANVFRLTNRDDHKGPALARWLTTKMGKKAAVVVDDGTPYGKGIADQFSSGFAAAGGAVVTRWTAKAGQTDFAAEVAGLPKDFDVLFFGGIKEGAYILKDMRKAGLNQVFACGDGCWSVGGFIKPAEGAATAGEGVRILSAAPALGKVPGSSEFAERYKGRFGPINNYAANSYDSARVVMSAIDAAATKKGGIPDRADVVAALKDIKFQGVAYGAPETFDAKGDNIAAVIFVNDVDGDRFREIDQIGGER
ncbi:MAG TPA: branched-chain amino acid ABC transporter substrate-binding protein [Roseiarcus sp.]|jgi:branched-chain amino acid transport system substrate-binding protein|nr:branched-chain amino acid ABC transporter substrate-binding protein [Roseiarcus sp.]